MSFDNYEFSHQIRGQSQTASKDVSDVVSVLNPFNGVRLCESGEKSLCVFYTMEVYLLVDPYKVRWVYSSFPFYPFPSNQALVASLWDQPHNPAQVSPCTPLPSPPCTPPPQSQVYVATTSLELSKIRLLPTG